MSAHGLMNQVYKLIKKKQDAVCFVSPLLTAVVRLAPKTLFAYRPQKNADVHVVLYNVD